MKRIVLIALFAVCAAGCATPPEQKLQERNRGRQFAVGTLQRHVLNIMGRDLLTAQDTKGGIRAIVPNPYSTETFLSGGKEYEVLYYFVNPKPKDGPITHDELLPFIFHQQRMTGKGWAYYETLKE